MDLYRFTIIKNQILIKNFAIYMENFLILIFQKMDQCRSKEEIGMSLRKWDKN